MVYVFILCIVHLLFICTDRVFVEVESIRKDVSKERMVNVQGDLRDVIVFSVNVRCTGILVFCEDSYFSCFFGKEKDVGQMCINVFVHVVISNRYDFCLCLNLSKVYKDSF